MAAVRFDDPGTPPDMAALAKRVGSALNVVIGAVDALGGEPGQVTHNWRFSKTSGWYLTYDRGRKRLFYLFPKKGGLLLKLVLNEAGVRSVRTADLPAAVRAKLATARTYAEGTVLEFTAEEIRLLEFSALLRIKIASMR